MKNIFIKQAFFAAAFCFSLMSSASPSAQHPYVKVNNDYWNQNFNSANNIINTHNITPELRSFCIAYNYEKSIYIPGSFSGGRGNGCYYELNEAVHGPEEFYLLKNDESAWKYVLKSELDPNTAVSPGPDEFGDPIYHCSVMAPRTSYSNQGKFITNHNTCYTPDSNKPHGQRFGVRADDSNFIVKYLHRVRR